MNLKETTSKQTTSKTMIRERIKYWQRQDTDGDIKQNNDKRKNQILAKTRYRPEFGGADDSAKEQETHE